MTVMNSKKPSISLAQSVVNALWPYVGGKRGMIILAITLAGFGMTMNWGWLVAVGAAPILLAVLPCAAMCGLGLCMKVGGGKSCSSGDKTTDEEPKASRDLDDNG